MIDVDSMCIKLLPEDAPYVALSYCWAKDPYLTLTKATLSDLEIPRSLTRSDVAPTVADAIEATRMLDQRYIWIDCLCICQDDDEDKVSQLNQMDMVYRTALLTIIVVSSSADGTDIGIPGIRNALERHSLRSVRIRGLLFRQRAESLFTSLSQKRWGTRAWTFQEFLLSRRLLVFDKTQAYFKCESTSFAEEYVDHVCMNAEETHEQKLAPCCDRTTSTSEGVLDQPVAVFPQNFHPSYEALVKSYTARHMSYDSDSLNAIRGMLNLLHREQSVSFLCGLPLPHLIGRYLAWCPLGISRRRKPTSEGVTFPSWTWAGWQGEAAYVTTEFPDGDFTPEEFTADGISVDLEDEETSSPRQIRLSKDDNIVEIDTMDSFSLMRLECCLLIFTAEVAHLQVESAPMGNPIDVTQNSKPMCRPIMVDGARAGSVIPHYYHPHYSTLLDAQPSLTYEFVALSKTKARWWMRYNFVPNEPSHDENLLYTNEDGVLIYHTPFDERIFDVYGSVKNVMLIHWIDGIAYRGGIGQIHSDAWMAAKSTLRDIQLG